MSVVVSILFIGKCIEKNTCAEHSDQLLRDIGVKYSFIDLIISNRKENEKETKDTVSNTCFNSSHIDVVLFLTWACELLKDYDETIVYISVI